MIAAVQLPPAGGVVGFPVPGGVVGLPGVLPLLSADELVNVPLAPFGQPAGPVPSPVQR